MKTIKTNNPLDIPKNYTGIVEYFDETKIYFLNGEFHREDGPAVEWVNGTLEWFYKGTKLNNDKINQFIENFKYPVEVSIKLAYHME